MVGLATAALLVTVAACGGSDDPGSSAEADRAVTTTEVADSSPATATTATTATATTAGAPSTTSTTLPVDEIDINHVQVIGSHNSYHLIPEPVLFEAIAALSPELASSIEYTHLPLTDQLRDHGIRQFEIDVFADPDGGLFASRAANPVVGLEAASGLAELDEPGFKVLHTQDFDYGTTCLTLVLCLEEIRDWSNANTNHVPIMVMIEMKEESVVDAAAAEGIELDIGLDWVEPIAITPALLDALDAEIRSVFAPEHIIEPDEVRGDAATLDEAVRTTGWPTLAASRGQALFTMTNGGRIRDLYSAGAPSLEGRPIFTSAVPGEPDAAFVRFDDPTDPGLDQAASDGYIIRTRTDSPTADARDNDTARRDAAFASGAHYLSTDYYVPSEFFDSDYVVEFTGDAVARCNPVTAPASCDDAELVE
jgi:hypothetical protein